MESVNEEKQAKSGFQELFHGKKLWITLTLIALFSFLVLPKLFFHKQTERKGPGTAETPDKRIVFSEKELRDLVQSSIKEAPQIKPKMVSSVPRKRNYATDIAVFIYEDKKETGKRTSTRNISRKIGLPSGSKVKAFLSGSVFSFNVASPVIAEVSEDVIWDGKAVIPKGSKFLGEAGVLKSLNRLNVNFDALVLPDGKELRVHAMALSEDGSAGIKGKVKKHRDLRILKAIAEAGIAGGSLFLGGVSQDPYSYEDQLRLNLAQNLTQEARNDIRNVKVDTSITAESFTPIQVILLDGI